MYPSVPIRSYSIRSSLAELCWAFRQSTILLAEFGGVMPVVDLTIIISNYNTRALLRNCLQSIYEHTRGIRFEVICVDGNSPDGSADMVTEEFPEVVLIRNGSNESYGRSVNRGLRASRGRYACLLDSDTLLIEDAFGPLLRFMEEHPEAAACGPRLLNP